VACQQPLAHSPSAWPVLPRVEPVRVAPPTVREVMAGTPVTPAHSVLPMHLLPGTLLFGRYQFRQEIGQGGFSVVYLAEDLREQRRLVAIKRIHLSTLTPRQVIDATETCNREIRLLSFLQAVEGVPRLYESFTDTENWYLMMEYIPGQTLEEYMQKASGGYLPESEVLEIGTKLVNLLERLHSTQQQVIFRDVKPANIMLRPDGRLYLIDFGIARFFTPGQKRDTTPLGTPGYAPPEQYGRAQTDKRADVYSLGATLQTLLTGRDPLDLTQGEVSRSPKAPSRRLRNLLDAMLEPDVHQRLATMTEVGRRLAWLENSSDTKRVALSLGTGVVLGALAGGILFWAFNGGRGGGTLIGLIWPFILIFQALTNRKKGSKKANPYLSKQFVVIGSIGVLLLALLLLLIQLVVSAL
ncbi:MAG: serine/threonine protein kinase, partial [Ktedonobacteraceae bacterium]